MLQRQGVKVGSFMKVPVSHTGGEHFFQNGQKIANSDKTVTAYHGTRACLIGGILRDGLHGAYGHNFFGAWVRDVEDYFGEYALLAALQWRPDNMDRFRTVALQLKVCTDHPTKTHQNKMVVMSEDCAKVSAEAAAFPEKCPLPPVLIEAIHLGLPTNLETSTQSVQIRDLIYKSFEGVYAKSQCFDKKNYRHIRNALFRLVSDRIHYWGFGGEEEYLERVPHSQYPWGLISLSYDIASILRLHFQGQNCKNRVRPSTILWARVPIAFREWLGTLDPPIASCSFKEGYENENDVWYVRRLACSNRDDCTISQKMFEEEVDSFKLNLVETCLDGESVAR